MRMTMMASTAMVRTALAADLVLEAEAASWGVNQIPAPAGAFALGETVAVSRDGHTALVAAPSEACAAGRGCGAAYVSVHEDQAWRLQARLSPSDEAPGVHFGGDPWADNTVALSADGTIAFIGIDPRPSIVGNRLVV